MHIVRRVSILLVAIAVLAAASSALGAFSAGFYRTKPPSSRTSFLDFSLKATSSNVTKIRYDFRKPNACNGGQTLSGDESPYTSATGAIPPASIKPSGRFNINLTDTGSTPGTLTIAGKLVGQVATGTLKVHASFSGGTITCDTGNMAWRALKLG
jgi:type II secretory pathway component PulK